MLRPELAWLDRRVAARVDGRPIAVTRVVLGVALMLVSLEQYLALSRIAGGAIAYPLYSGAPEVRGGLAVAVLVVGWISGVCLILGLLPEVRAAAGAVRPLTLLCDQQLYSSHVTLLIILLVLSHAPGRIGGGESPARDTETRRVSLGGLSCSDDPSVRGLSVRRSEGAAHIPRASPALRLDVARPTPQRVRGTCLGHCGDGDRTRICTLDSSNPACSDRAGGILHWSIVTSALGGNL